MNSQHSKYLVYSLDVTIGGEILIGEPETQKLVDILMWLDDEIGTDAKYKIPQLEPGETYLFSEGQHGPFETREIHFVKLKD